MLSVATAQDMTVNSVIEATDDTSASDYPQADVNGDPTALVKVTMPVNNATFEGSVIGNVAYNKGDELPMENISWEHCQLFINKLNQLTGLQFRLPTEAEWEYAARGGQKGQGLYYSGSKKLKEVGWYNKNSENRTHPVRQLAPNELGLYDMTGNVREWCQDWHAPYPHWLIAPSEYKGPETGTKRIIRGGGIYSVGYTYEHYSQRGREIPYYYACDLGLRLAL